MSPILFIAYLLGLVLKLLHLPYHTVVLLVVVATGITTSASSAGQDLLEHRTPIEQDDWDRHLPQGYGQ